MLRLTGRLADGWLPSSAYAPPEELAAMNKLIDEAAAAAGRQPADVRRLYNVGGSFTGGGTEFLTGPASVWVEQLAELALDEGMSGFVLMTDDPSDLARFAEEVAPGVRELVARERAGTTAPEPVEPREPGEPAVVRLATPTPDDGRRLSDTALWDESARPTGPPVQAGASYHDQGRASGAHLVEIHDHLRQELSRIREMLRQVRAGALDVGAARAELSTMTMRQNNWTLGAYCESYCRFVTLHHTLEDRSLFPHLRRFDPRLGPVLDRLADEHRVIHGVLDRVDAALVAMVNDPTAIDRLGAEVDLLTDTLLSHLSYEERELIEPIARAPQL
jgi:hemerythrin HHE cation binding domain-containing protein/luciferase-like monooxygenase